MALGVDLDAGATITFRGFDTNGIYAIAGAVPNRNIAPLAFNLYIWDVNTGTLRTLSIPGDAGFGVTNFITDENELITRDGGNGLGTLPTHLRIYDLSDLSLLTTIALDPYIAGFDFNNNFDCSEIEVAGSKYIFGIVGPYISFRGPYLILKRTAGAWDVFNYFASDGTTILGYSGISAGAKYAYLRSPTTIGRVEWFGGQSEARITPSGLGSRHMISVSYLPLTDEVLVLTGGPTAPADPTIEAQVYSADLSTLIRSATIYTGTYLTDLRGIDNRILVSDTLAIVPITDSTHRITQLIAFDVNTLAVDTTIDVYPSGDYVNQTANYQYYAVNDDTPGVYVGPQGTPRHFSFWPFPLETTPVGDDITADVEVPLGIIIEAETQFLSLDLCPIMGLGDDQCIVGRTSIPPGIGQILCGQHQPTETTCGMTVSRIYLGIDVDGDLVTTTAAQFLLIADTATFILTGQEATRQMARLAAVAQYILTGMGITFASHSLAAGTAAYVLTGRATTLTHRSLVATPASFTLSGSATGLAGPGITHALAATPATFTVTASVTLLKVTMPAGAGSFTLTGIGTFRGATTIATAASYSLTGVASLLKVTMPAGTASYALTGKPVSMAGSLASFQPTPAAYVVTRNEASLNVTMPAAVATFTLTGF